ncbi:MAG: zinc ABC transporter substrate-binding protein [Alistipes sp.]|nr:zinc ABC transporter substrate-binding protein [Alistipes sp.]
MKFIRHTPLLLLLLLLLTGCQSRPATTDERTIYASIAPIKGLVERIVGDDFPVEVLVPVGASPETFEPTARQIVALNRAQWLFAVGLIDFEQALLQKLGEQVEVISLHEGVELIAGCCAHHHHADHAHTHGVDPHIWSSPRALTSMAETIYRTIHAAYPDSLHYTARYEQLREELSALDQRTAERIAAARVSEFMIYHPALTYYARDYGLRQTAIEEEGKEPSARRIAELIRHARQAGLKRILYQRQFPRSTVEAAAKDMQAEAVEFDPLNEDFLSEIDRITTIITEQ